MKPDTDTHMVMRAGREKGNRWEGEKERVREENGDGKHKRVTDRGIRELKEKVLGRERKRVATEYVVTFWSKKKRWRGIVNS